MKRPWAAQRVDLYLSGVKVPKLGSSQDIVLRKFLTNRSSKEVYLNKLLARTALNTSEGKKELIDDVTSSWNDYVNLVFYLENTKEEKTKEMMEEYEVWKKIMPKVKLGKDGKLVVTGIPQDF